MRKIGSSSLSSTSIFVPLTGTLICFVLFQNELISLWFPIVLFSICIIWIWLGTRNNFTVYLEGTTLIIKNGSKTVQIERSQIKSITIGTGTYNAVRVQFEKNTTFGTEIYFNMPTIRPFIGWPYINKEIHELVIELKNSPK